MEKQLLKLDTVCPLLCSLGNWNGNRQMRELRESAVHMRDCQLFLIALLGITKHIPICDLTHSQMGKKRKGICTLPRPSANQPLHRLLPPLFPVFLFCSHLIVPRPCHQQMQHAFSSQMGATDVGVVHLFQLQQLEPKHSHCSVESR